MVHPAVGCRPALPAHRVRRHGTSLHLLSRPPAGRHSGRRRPGLRGGLVHRRRRGEAARLVCSRGTGATAAAVLPRQRRQHLPPHRKPLAFPQPRPGGADLRLPRLRPQRRPHQRGRDLQRCPRRPGLAAATGLAAAAADLFRPLPRRRGGGATGPGNPSRRPGAGDALSLHRRHGPAPQPHPLPAAGLAARRPLRQLQQDRPHPRPAAAVPGRPRLHRAGDDGPPAVRAGQ